MRTIGLMTRSAIIRQTRSCLASNRPGQPVRFFGDAIPASFAETETPVLCRIRSAHVVALDATRPTRRDGGGREARDRSPRARAAAGTSLPHLDLLTRPVCGCSPH